eukprot:Sdes_comp16099_c0_seq2m5314
MADKANIVGNAIISGDLRSAEHYELLELIGRGATASVYAARCIPLNEKVAIKCIDLEKYGANIDELRKEIQVMSQCHHENVVTYYTSFVVKTELWLVMRILNGGSALDIMKNCCPKGMDEILIITILKEVLKGLEYFHKCGQIHRDVKAGNILIDTDGSVQLADFGVSSWLCENGERKNTRQTFVGTPCWMAPEVMEQVHGYDYKADIWSFGITAIELASGQAPFAKYPPMKVLMLTLQNPPPTLDLNGQHKNYSKSFKRMVDACLQKDPTKRPTAYDLLKFPIFSKARNKDFIRTELIAKMPALGARSIPVKSPVKNSEGGSFKKGDEIGWNFDTSTDGETAKSPDSEPGDFSNIIPASSCVINLKLRLRDTQNQLKDVRFTYTIGEDTSLGIAAELVDAGLIEESSLKPVSENMEKIILNRDSEVKDIRFSIVDDNFSGKLDADTLEGFAQLSIQ